jgi:hypothetical protein
VGLEASAGRRSQRSFWTLSLYPDAGEGGGCLRVATRSRDGYGEPDPDRARAEAARRARTKVRRYVVANRLNRFVTLTYGGDGCFDPKVVRADVGSFFRSLRPTLGGGAFPYAWAPEWHPGGHGLHAHFAVGRYVPQRLIRDTWARGIVHVKLIGDLPVGSGLIAEARRVAGYLCKYVGKEFDDERRASGLHRYEVAQGFQPQTVTFTGRTDDEVVEQAAAQMGEAPGTVWRSSSVEGWHGPPAVWVAWDG